MAPEQARLLIPSAYGMYTAYYWTASLQSVCHFINQRLAHDSQYEIQQYAKAVHELVKPIFPVSLEELLKE
ncbi:FAD-dependent thymidylate synthase [Paenibacillus herberti]|uniref:FAD-dependent thymidylate synthase n=1 Tax=Paenibacillus herberti TaxID=1619309 RepID=UPI003182FF5D